jgi:hypothetical protein
LTEKYNSFHHHMQVRDRETETGKEEEEEENEDKNLPENIRSKQSNNQKKKLVVYFISSLLKHSHQIFDSMFSLNVFLELLLQLDRP